MPVLRRRILSVSLAVALQTVTSCSLAWTQAATPAQPQTPQSHPDAAVNQKVHLQAEQLTLPLVLVKGFPFLEGEINGTSGKLLFDIGEEASFALNSHRIQPPDGKEVGKGYFGSGQTFSVYRFPVVDHLQLAGGPEYTAIPNVRGNPGLPLEQHITPDFIGWIGLHWFEGYILKLDYAHPSITFYKNDSGAAGSTAGMQAALKGEKVLQVVHFHSGDHPNISAIPALLGTHTFLATLDTGSHNTLWLTPELREQLKTEGVLRQQDNGSFELTSISIDGHRIDLNSHTELNTGTASVAKNLGNPTDPIMTLGYEFLSRYKTVWDYQNQTITLLER